jgi:1A family penicillin-binding protein
MRTGKKQRKKSGVKVPKTKKKNLSKGKKETSFSYQITSTISHLLKSIGFPFTQLLILTLKLLFWISKTPHNLPAKNATIGRVFESVKKLLSKEHKKVLNNLGVKTKTARKKARQKSFVSSKKFRDLLDTKIKKKQLTKALLSLKSFSAQRIVYVSSGYQIQNIKATFYSLLKRLFRSIDSSFLQVRQITSKRILRFTKATALKNFSIKLPSLPKFEINKKQSQPTESFKLYSNLPRPLEKLSVITEPFVKLLNFSITIKFRYVAIVGIFIAFGSACIFGYQHLIKDLPDPSQLSRVHPQLTTKIYDRNGLLLYKIYKDENRSLIPLTEIPDHVIQATVAIEDQNFYQHPGFSIRGITRALKSNLTDEETLQGGSTITQQLIKNTLLSSERTWERKLKELFLSFATEFYYSKDEILAMYLNQVPYGGAAYGVEEASQMYFDKSVTELNLAEAAYLAGLPVSPTKYSPYGPHPEYAKDRQKQVLRRMVEDGYITSEEGQSALTQEIAIHAPKATLLAPHFVMYVRDVLADLYGSQMVESGGLEVTTSLDMSVQDVTQKIVTEEVSRLKNLNVNNGAAVVTNPANGQVLAMVGSTNYYDSSNDGQVNVTLRNRQPGSSIKPLMYSMALERGLTPATLIEDSPICFNIQGQPPYCPKNYDGSYHGRVTIRQALANSYNIPAVKTLAQFSVNDFIDHASGMGISTWEDRNRFGLSLTLGGGEVKMVDMAIAYGVFANQGKRVNLRPILEVKDSEGNLLAINPCISADGCTNQQVLDSRVAYQITDILSDNNARSQAFGLGSVLYIPGQQVGVKTGTTNSLRDNWTIGYTQDRVVVAWVGNNDNSRMSNIASGITGASPIWNKVMLSQLSAENPHQFAPPTNLAKVNICTITGQLACNGCPSREEYFIPGTEPSNHCSSDTIANILNPKAPED